MLRDARVTRALVLLACASFVAGIVGSTQAASARHRVHQAPGPRVAPKPAHPNIVFVLTDDLSMNLLRFMPHVQQMERQGMTFQNYFVSDSLCCPSRASIFSGNLPHDTGIYSNTGPHGGFDQFYLRAEEQHTFATALQRAGYQTAMMGKYLNGYMLEAAAAAAVPDTYIPPGWNEWDVVGWGYPEFNYVMNQDGVLNTYGDQPGDYLTDVLSDNAVRFIDNTAPTRSPFFLEVATFAPHSPYVPAPRNQFDFPGLQAPAAPNFDELPSHPPKWLSGHQLLTADQFSQLDAAYRGRAQSVEAVDAMIGRIEDTLRANGELRNTYIVFSSDNGFHIGEYRLMPGKMTAFDTDIRVPLVVMGPGVTPGSRTGAVAENIDLAKTFAGLGGTGLPSDGHSLVPLLLGKAPVNWRNAALIEHRGPRLLISDPDFQKPGAGNPTSYEAMRTRNFLYVEYKDGERELYNLVDDPYELDNLAPSLSQSQRALLHQELMGLAHCHGGVACWAAMHVDPLSTDVIRRLTGGTGFTGKLRR